MIQTNKKKLIIIGGKGNGTVIASAIEDYIEKNGGWEIIGYLNDFEKKDTMFNGLPVLDKIDNINRYNKKDCYFIYALLSAGKAFERKKKLTALGISNDKFATFVHPTAVVSNYSQLGKGVVIMPHVVISPNVFIGDHTHIYANAFVGHDTTVNNFCFIANNASLGSTIVLQEGVHIGSNSTILEKVSIGEWSLVGIGSVILKNVPPYVKIVGNPAKTIGDVNIQHKNSMYFLKKTHV
jgi:acetyltransferase EpsM